VAALFGIPTAVEWLEPIKEKFEYEQSELLN
jgi:hypothetical protein